MALRLGLRRRGATLRSRCAAALGSRAVGAGLSVLLAIAAAGILDLVQVQNHTRPGLMGVLGLPGLLVIAGDDVDVRALLELHALDALAHIPERLDGKVEPAVVFLRLAVVDPFPDPEVGNLPGVFAIATIAIIKKTNNRQSWQTNGGNREEKRK